MITLDNVADVIEETLADITKSLVELAILNARAAALEHFRDSEDKDHCDPCRDFWSRQEEGFHE